MVQSDVLLPTYIQVAIAGSIIYCLTNDTIFTRVQRYFYLRIGRELHSESMRIVVSGPKAPTRQPTPPYQRTCSSNPNGKERVRLASLFTLTFHTLLHSCTLHSPLPPFPPLISCCTGSNQASLNHKKCSKKKATRSGKDEVAVCVSCCFVSISRTHRQTIIILYLLVSSRVPKQQTR